METPNISNKLQMVLEEARKASESRNAVYTGTEHLVYGCLCVDCKAGRLLREAGVVKAEYEAEFFRGDLFQHEILFFHLLILPF